MRPMKKMLAVLACVGAVGIALSASALTIGDSQTLGIIDYGIPAGDGDLVMYVDHLRQMAVNTSDSALGQTFHRSANVFAPLDAPVLSWRTAYGDTTASTVSVNLGTSGFMYLLAKYDGPNYGSVVWYINGMTGTVAIPTKAGQYGLSGASLFTPGTNRVPDGGTTAMLLGVALSGLAMLRRILS